MNTISCKSPAKEWKDAFAVGNGRLGAMVYGNVQHEIISMNEESLWSKPYAFRNNRNAKSSLKKIRELLKLERPQEAQELVYETFTALPEEQAFYKSAGRVHLDFYNRESYGLDNSYGIRDKAFGTPVFYKRELDLETAVAATTFTEETVLPSTDDFSRNTTGSSITYNREVFVSTQEDVLAIHIWASTPRSIYLRASLENENADKKYSCGEDIIGIQSFNGIPFAMMLGAVAPGGKVSVSGNSLIVEDADEVTLYVDVETAFALSSFAKKSYRQFKNARLASKASDIALKKICFAMNARYASIKQAHIDENSAIFSKMQLSLGEQDSQTESTPISLESVLENTSSPEYAELYFKYMRYLYLNSTKPRAKLPPLENGLFSNPDDELWHERYYFDRLYPYGLTGCLCNAKKSDEALFKFLKKINKNGKRTAFEMFGAEGSTAFDSTDIWGDTAPCGTELDSSYNAAGLARLAALVTEYYESTLNKKFIKKNAGIIKNACAFFENYLVLVDEKSRAILNPAFSKGEKQFITEGNFELEKEIADL